MLATTMAQEFRVKNKSLYDNEVRVERAGCFRAFQDQTRSSQAIINNKLRDKFAMSTGRATKATVLNDIALAVRIDRPLVIPYAENTSAFMVINSFTMAAGFTMQPAQHFNNEVDEQADFDMKYKRVIRSFMTYVEEQAETKLGLDKTQVATPYGDNVSFAGDVITETLPNGSKQVDSKLLHSIKPILNQNRHYAGADRVHVVGNYGLQALLEQQASYGGYNQENKQIQWMGKKFTFSEQIDNAANQFATGYAIAPESIGMMTRVEIDSLRGTTLATGHKWGQAYMPMFDEVVGVYEYENAIDITQAVALNHGGVSHLTRTGMRAIDFAVDVALVSHYVSDRATIPSKIYKIQAGISPT